MSKEIVQKDAPVLRKLAKNVPSEDITSPKIQKIIQEMKDALASQDDGVAIAAPQIGYDLRIFVVSGKTFAIMNGEDEKVVKYPDVVFINPVLSKLSRKKVWMEEGCLSVRKVYGKVRRSEKATVTAYDQTGKKITRGASGLLAQIFQHETDHLDGVLFIDKAKELEEIDINK